MTIEEAKQYINANTVYGNENAPIGSSARSYFESELRFFLAGYNQGVYTAADKIISQRYDSQSDALQEILKLKII